MKHPSHGPTEILRYPNGGFTIVTKAQWRSFLKNLLTDPTKVLVSSSTRSTGTYGVAEVR